MRPWMGAVAVAAAMLVAPGAAVAGEDDPAQIQFKLPSSAAMPEFESLGGMSDEGVTKNADGSVLASAWVTDDELAQFKAHGFEPVATLSSKYEIDAIRADRNETLAKLKASIDALHGKGVKAKGKSAAGDIHAQRADYYENLGGRWLSVEANAEGARYTG